jgi:hypothetical protein
MHGTRIERPLCWALAAAAAAIAPQQASAQRAIVAPGPYLHRPANAVFPLRVGEFRRSDIYQYDPQGRDVSASYNLTTPQGRLLISLYIYPAAPSGTSARVLACEEEFRVVQAAISSQHANAVPVEKGEALPVAGVGPGLAHRAVYRFRSPFDQRVQEIRSEAHLYCYVAGDWLVKYRVSAPVAVETGAAVEAFIRAGPWPGRASGEIVASARR